MVSTALCSLLSPISLSLLRHAKVRLLLLTHLNMFEQDIHVVILCIHSA